MPVLTPSTLPPHTPPPPSTPHPPAQFSVEYRRLGFTWLSLQRVVPVRPFRHNEYERFIVAAYPYYGSAFSMMAAFLVFGIVFLYHRDPVKKAL